MRRSIHSTQSIHFVHAVLEVHRQFSCVNDWYSRLFNYLDANYYEHSAIKLKDHGWQIFRSLCFEGGRQQHRGVKHMLADIVLDLIKAVRQQSFIDPENMIGQSVSIFVQMDKLSSPEFRIYETAFENPFLEISR
jgi:hypothetical protein